jgi:hypothetical protein
MSLIHGNYRRTADEVFIEGLRAYTMYVHESNCTSQLSAQENGRHMTPSCYIEQTSQCWLRNRKNAAYSDLDEGVVTGGYARDVIVSYMFIDCLHDLLVERPLNAIMR